MMRSLYAGVAGLKTHQSKMDVLGNNIANVNTTSFKSQSITFSDLMYQTTQTASSATLTKGGTNARQVGLGAKSGAIQTAIEAQGATQTTNNPFDLMITGKAFFVVNNGAEQLYTRDGSFYIDGAGNLAMQSNGYLVQGWVAQEDKETGEIKVNKNGGLSGLQILSADNSTYSPASTTSGLYSGNIDDNDTNITSDEGKTVTLEFYDNKGYLYTGKFTLKDTGTEHLFSLQLKDIIDSNGNSIGKGLMQGVSFGQTETVEAPVDEAYELTIGKTTADIILLPGAEKFSTVPPEGTLSDLMTTSRSAYAGVLKEVYGVTDEMVTGGALGYSKTDTYSIADDGRLTITYEVTEATASTYTQGYSQYANTDKYYVATNGTGVAYKVPLTTEPTAVQGTNKFIQKTFTDIFGVQSNKLQEYTSDSKYVYRYDSSSDKLTVYRDPKLINDDKGTAKYNFTPIANYEYFNKGTPTLQSVIEAYDNAHQGQTYSYLYNFNYTTLELKVYSTLDENTPIGNFTLNNDTYNNTQAGNYTQQTPNIRFENSSDGKTYVVSGDEQIVGDYSKELLKDVFNLTKDSAAVKSEYLTTLTTGKLRVYHVDEKQYNTSAQYAAQKNQTTGTLSFVTTNPETEYSEIPLTGNLVDLLETAEGPYQGVLKKVYGLTDADADAFGTDGTYSINTDGSLSVTTGTQTIQLKFDPANGSLTTANGRADGMVNLIFDQSIPGLEAFGYQQLPTDDPDSVIPGRLTLDFSTVTNYNTSGSATIKAVKGDKKSLNTGRAVGELNGVSVATDGQIYASYSNGQTKLLGQIASAEFANASGLSKEGDNMYASTLNSGDPTIQDITTDGGYMSTGVLEMSNVDLSKEFTEMITTQRGFQANSRIITVSDTLLEELTNLKR